MHLEGSQFLLITKYLFGCLSQQEYERCGLVACMRRQKKSGGKLKRGGLLRFLGIAKRMALILILEYEVPEM
jgi:hypothetical protein